MAAADPVYLCSNWLYVYPSPEAFWVCNRWWRSFKNKIQMRVSRRIGLAMFCLCIGTMRGEFIGGVCHVHRRLRKWCCWSSSQTYLPLWSSPLWSNCPPSSRPTCTTPKRTATRLSTKGGISRSLIHIHTHKRTPGEAEIEADPALYRLVLLRLAWKPCGLSKAHFCLT